MKIGSLKLRSFSIIAAAILPCAAALSGARADAQPLDDRQSVARISYLSGDVSYSRGDDPDDWQAPVRNDPFTLGDRLYSSGSGRAELQIHGGEFVRMAPQTDLAALNLTEEVKQFSLRSGTASFQLRRLDENEAFEVDTPNAAVTFERPGDYRVDVDANGNSRVSCLEGAATVAAAGGEVPLRQGDQMWIDGSDYPQYDVAAIDQPDSWDHWVRSREDRFSRVASYRYANFNMDGLDDLDQYGRWVNVPGYGQCWTPSTVDVGWQPYRTGRWIWQDPWGWTWIADEPWGWAPYHYGRWTVYASQWYWVPEGPSVAVHYSPALVAFVGGGPGWSLSVNSGGGGYVGWFPLAPRDPFVPWWGSRANVNVNVTNVNYGNRTYVTVVNQNTFVSGGVVTANAVRDPQIVRQIATSAVIRGAVPVVPTAGAIRMSVRAGAAPGRPPAAIAARSVVTRVPPPPAPAPFQAKLDVIRQNRGAPLAPAAQAQLSIQSHQGAKALVPVRPVVSEAGRMNFQPRNGQSSGPKAEAVKEYRGKPIATMEHPIVSSPTAAAATAPGAPAARIAPGAVVAPSNIPPNPREGNPRGFERRAPPPQPPTSAAPPPPQNPNENEQWRQRQPNRTPPGENPAPPPPPPQDRRFERQPPPGQNPAPPPPPPQDRRYERQPPPGENPAPPPPPPQDRRFERQPPPGQGQNASPDNRARGNEAKDQGKNAKDKKDKKNKKDEPPPPPQ